MTKAELATLVSALPTSTAVDTLASACYDGMADAIVWSDEIGGLEPQVIWMLRPVLRARTCIIIGAPIEFASELADLRNACASWIGFRNERMQPSESLAEFFRGEQARFRRDLDEL